MINVALETGTDRRGMTTRALEALGDDFVHSVKEAQSILLKVNLVHHERQLASTHVDAARGVIDALRVHSQAKTYVGDAAYRGTPAAFRNLGYERLQEEYSDVELVDLNEDEYIDGYTIRSDGSKNPIRRSKLAHDVDLRISLTPMKIDRDIGVSLSVKNWTIGTWIAPSRIGASGRVWARWPWLNEEGPEAHHKSIMELYRQLPCEFSVVDGVVAMEGDGPVRGDAVKFDVVLAGADPVAVDAVAATLMGVDPADVGYLGMCRAEGLGSTDLTHINVPPMLMHEKTRTFKQPLHFQEKLRARRNDI